MFVVLQPFYGGKRDQLTAELYSPQDKKTPFCTVKGAWNSVMWARYVQGVSIFHNSVLHMHSHFYVVEVIGHRLPLEIIRFIFFIENSPAPFPGQML